MLRLFYLENCPHCQRAKQWIRELYQENPEYQKVTIEMIDEAKEVELANSYDYYYVPSLFKGHEKLHEGVASKEKIKNIFDQCLKEEAK